MCLEVVQGLRTDDGALVLALVEVEKCDDMVWGYDLSHAAILVCDLSFHFHFQQNEVAGLSKAQGHRQRYCLPVVAMVNQNDECVGVGEGVGLGLGLGCVKRNESHFEDRSAPTLNSETVCAVVTWMGISLEAGEGCGSDRVWSSNVVDLNVVVVGAAAAGFFVEFEFLVVVFYWWVLHCGV